MRCTSLAVLLPLSFLPLAFGAEYLVGVGKDETTGYVYRMHASLPSLSFPVEKKALGLTPLLFIQQ